LVGDVRDRLPVLLGVHHRGGVVVTAREFARHWRDRGFPPFVVNQLNGKVERPAFVTLVVGPNEGDEDPDEESEDPPLAAE
jgi:hypothetical protein